MHGTKSLSAASAAGLFALAGMLVGNSAAYGQSEKVLHIFQGQTGNDGYFPQSSGLVLDSAGNLYGTTQYGGGTSCLAGGEPGCGIIYQLQPPAQSGSAWTYNVIWRFQGGTDGSFPGGLFLVNSTLWGEVLSGGTGSCTGGCGYLFQLTPPSMTGGSWTKTDVFDFPNSGAVCGISTADAAATSMAHSTTRRTRMATSVNCSGPQAAAAPGRLLTYMTSRALRGDTSLETARDRPE